MGEVEGKIDDPYMTVNEGLTTDTSVTTDIEGAVGSQRTAQEDLKEDAGGIQSSDEELETPVMEQEQEKARFNETSMFKDEKSKDV